MVDIKFNVPPYVDKAADYIQECVKNQKICGDGEYTKKCNAWIEERTGTGKCLLTTSCTHATELAALLCDIKPGIVLLSADACGIQSLAGSGFLSDRTDGRGYA